MFLQERKAFICRNSQWWLQVAAMEHKNQFDFLKNPFVVEHQLEWFHPRSSTKWYVAYQSVCNDLSHLSTQLTPEEDLSWMSTTSFLNFYRESVSPYGLTKYCSETGSCGPCRGNRAEYLMGMMELVTGALMKNGMKQQVAQRKARLYQQSKDCKQ